MSNFTHYNGDPLFATVKAILEGKEIDTTPSDLEEGVEEIQSKVKDLKVGDKTNFGIVTKIESSSVTFKTKDIPATKISFNQRKMGSKDFVLDRLAKLKEDISIDLEEGVEEIKAKVKDLKVGDKTNFGTVLDIGSESVTFKTKDIPKTKISFNQRKMGSKDFVLDRLAKIKNVKEDVDPTIVEAVGLASNTLKGQVVSLMQLNTSVKVAHWHASTSINTHKALGDLYDAIEEGLDTFAEIEMGISKNRQFINMSCETRGDYSVPALINELRERAEALVNTSKALGCEDLANIAADLLGAVNKAAYLLEA